MLTVRQKRGEIVLLWVVGMPEKLTRAEDFAPLHRWDGVGLGSKGMINPVQSIVTRPETS